jgi:hypothetical protein
MARLNRPIGAQPTSEAAVVGHLYYGQTTVEDPGMNAMPPALQFLLLTFAGWVNRRQQKVIDYLLEENRVLREQLGGRRLRLTNDQRRRLAAKGKLLGRKLLGKIAGIVTPDTILRWYHVLFVIELSTRRIEVAGITRQPTSAWMIQVGRNLTDIEDGFLRDTRYLILDRDPLFTDAYRKLLSDGGVKPLGGVVVLIAGWTRPFCRDCYQMRLTS